MKSFRSYGLTVLTCIAGCLVTYALLLLLGSEVTSLIFIMGAIAGSQMAAWRMYLDQQTTELPFAAKLGAGLTLSATNTLLGGILTLVNNPFPFPEVSIGIAAIGSAFFPFVLTGTLVKGFAGRDSSD